MTYKNYDSSQEEIGVERRKNAHETNKRKISLKQAPA